MSDKPTEGVKSTAVSWAAGRVYGYDADGICIETIEHHVRTKAVRVIPLNVFDAKSAECEALKAELTLDIEEFKRRDKVLEEAANNTMRLIAEREALKAENERLGYEVSLGLISHKALIEQCAGLERGFERIEAQLDAATKRAEALERLLRELAVRPSFHHLCDDYARGYGDCQAGIANSINAAIAKGATT